ncbi:hypothetical protein GGP41_003735 [Bipolaris sorokiniana]|uniref:Uncharacterized protein n=2 Tax=Cochliobolus sativus TaxID=45130 RepID=A0A8H5ZEA5_COCSA|nr:uncharacterized protein COCSADRAFT_356431 [Bipolaris sorokiniana ND90Pr]EMD65088.1 hypothetical protein COCSADRAFT_356431 [Bipolaris sorokiniana ND90Pr]KAF5846313.1 hypothetical protein GGP41_003735 [Bipolaris sorokiniana]
MPSLSSIQFYFSSSPSKKSDGFIAGEMQSALAPAGVDTASTWTPTLDYGEADIGSLEPGPCNFALMGRIVNFSDQVRPSKSHKAAQGCIKVMVADNTGVLTVRLWYAETRYKLKLGQLVGIWTVHISNSSEFNALAPSTAPLFTSMFPEGERNCHFAVYEGSDDGTRFKRPYGVKESRALAGLMTLKSFMDGGYDVDEPKLLVCVRSIGARKKYMNRNGTTSELISLGIFDDTADGLLTLYSSMCDSASLFTPFNAILLISNPSWRIDRMAKLTITSGSRVDIDPDMGDARRLRAMAQYLTKREHVNPPFTIAPTAIEDFENATIKALYTLAEIDSVARSLSNSGKKERIVGYLSVLITGLNIVTPFKRNMLMSNECCGIPLFANSINVKCKHCENVVTLRINPRILGPILDETGQIGSGKLILSDDAWCQLLGRTPHQLVETDLDVLLYLEQRLLFLRLTMGFVLDLEDEIARLAIWCVRN